MDYPVSNRYGFDQRLSSALKFLAILVAVWLLNVAFVAVHEGGHSAVAAAFGAQIYSVYISPTGLEGATTHTQLTDTAQSGVVLAAGVLATTLAVIVAYLVRLEIGVYVFGLRTVESLLNYTAGADMLGLYQNLGSETYLISIGLITIAGLFFAICLHKRLNTWRVASLARKPVNGVPVSAL